MQPITYKRVTVLADDDFRRATQFLKNSWEDVQYSDDYVRVPTESRIRELLCVTASEVSSQWSVVHNMPLVVLTNMPTYLVSEELIDLFTGDGLIQNACDGFVAQNPQWDPATNCASLKFCDPGVMMKWIDSENNASTAWTWQGSGCNYKDRGVSVRYDQPPKSNDDDWRRPLGPTN